MRYLIKRSKNGDSEILDSNNISLCKVEGNAMTYYTCTLNDCRFFKILDSSAFGGSQVVRDGSNVLAGISKNMLTGITTITRNGHSYTYKWEGLIHSHLNLYDESKLQIATVDRSFFKDWNKDYFIETNDGSEISNDIILLITFVYCVNTTSIGNKWWT